jgi:hypothetical protein
MHSTEDLKRHDALHLQFYGSPNPWIDCGLDKLRSDLTWAWNVNRSDDYRLIQSYAIHRFGLKISVHDKPLEDAASDCFC